MGWGQELVSPLAPSTPGGHASRGPSRPTPSPSPRWGQAKVGVILWVAWCPGSCYGA